MPDELDLIIENCHEVIDLRDGKKLRELTDDLHYADLARLYEELDAEESLFFLETIGAERFADLVADLPNSLVRKAIGHFEDEEQREILTSLPDDDLVDVLQGVGQKRRKHYLSVLDSKSQERTKMLLRYGPETAGGRMTTQVGKVFADMTVQEAVESLRDELESTETLARIFVVDQQQRLLGKIRLRDLAFNERNVRISDLMAQVEHAVLATADQEDAASMLKKYDMLLLPVIDEEDRLVGVLTYDDAMHILEQESTEDIEKIAGIGGEQSEETYLNTSIFTHFRRRSVWLVGLAAMGMVSGSIMMRFEHVLSHVFLLSLFLPMVIAAGGNSGGQASTMMVRALALNEVGVGDLLRIALKELRLGALLGALLGTSLACVSLVFLPLFHPEMPEGISLLLFVFTVAISLAAQVTSSTFLGATLPLVARMLKLDPAVIAAPAITSMVDATGLLIYFSVAKILLGL